LNLRRQQADRPAFAWSFGPQPAAQADLDAHLAAWGINYRQLYQATCDLRNFGVPYAGPALPPRQSIWGWTTKPQAYGRGTYDEFDYLPLAAAETIEEIQRHPWPHPDHMDYAALPGLIRQADPDHRCARVLWGGNVLETFSWMTGLERTLILLLTEPEVVHAALEHITGFYLAVLQRALEAAPGEWDAVFMADDLGSQHGALVSRDTYRQMLVPYHQRLNSVAHRYGMPTIHHSDGSVYGLLADLVEAGVDCLEAVQVECADMAPQKLKADFGTRLAFMGAVSVQQVLPVLSSAQVRDQVRQLKGILGAGGGYVCAPSHAIQAGTPPQNVVAMVEEAVEGPMDQIAKEARVYH
jgi:uroporphyrinogen decarboxylase